MSYDYLLPKSHTPKSEIAPSQGRFVLYARKSTEQDERQSQSIESQKTRAAELAKRLGVRIIDVYEESKSAKEPGRPLFNELLRRIDAGEVDGIMAWHPDRLARNEKDGSELTYRLRKGVLKDLAFVEYSFINSPEGIMVLQIVFSQTQYQVSKLSIEVTRGLEDKVALGWNPHRAPLGYRNDTHLIKGQRSISRDPDRFPLLRRAWHLLIDGSHSVEQVRLLLNDAWGFRTPVSPSGRGGKILARSSMYRILSNPFYAGLFIHAGEVHKGAHEPMVTVEEFKLVQERIRREKLGAKPGEVADSPVIMPLGMASDERPFTGLIRCAKCGSMVTSSVKVKPSGKRYVYYHCSNSRGICPRSGVREDDLQYQIESVVRSIEIDDTFYRWAIEDINKAFHVVRDSQEAQKAQRQRALNETAQSMDALVDMRLRGLLDDDEYLTRRNRLKQDQNRLEIEDRIGDAHAEQVRDSCLNVAEFARNAREWLIFGDAKMKRTVARQLVSNWILDGKNLVPELTSQLRTIGEIYPVLHEEMRRIELGEIGSWSTKKEAVASVRRRWSDIWYKNRTL